MQYHPDHASAPLPHSPAVLVAVMVAVCVLVGGALDVERSSGLFTRVATNDSSLSSATLQPPTGTAVSGPQSTSLDITWNASGSAFTTGYDLLRAGTPGGPYVLVQSFGSGTLSYTDPGLTPATTYYYVVRATAGNWTSVDSTEASDTTLP
jgi:hypothetical protein